MQVQGSAELKIISGDDQRGTIGTALENPFVVEVRDGSGNPVPNSQVTFTVTADGGMLSHADDSGATSMRLVSDDTGRAQITLTLGQTWGRTLSLYL